MSPSGRLSEPLQTSLSCYSKDGPLALTVLVLLTKLSTDGIPWPVLFSGCRDDNAMSYVEEVLSESQANPPPLTGNILLYLSVTSLLISSAKVIRLN